MLVETPVTKAKTKFSFFKKGFKMCPQASIITYYIIMYISPVHICYQLALLLPSTTPHSPYSITSQRTQFLLTLLWDSHCLVAWQCQPVFTLLPNSSHPCRRNSLKSLHRFFRRILLVALNIILSSFCLSCCSAFLICRQISLTGNLWSQDAWLRVVLVYLCKV